MKINTDIKLNNEQQVLVVENYGLAVDYIHKILQRNTLPDRYVEDFVSEIYYRLCLSAYYFNADLGFQFSTFAYGGFEQGLLTIIKKIRSERVSLLEIEWLEVGNDKLLKDTANKDIINALIKRGKLTKVEKDMLLEYFIGGLNFEELGSRHKCSREKARYIYNRALQKTQECCAV